MTPTKHRQGPGVRVWMAKHLLEEIRLEAARHAHEETGGMLLGHWAETEAVITTCIGPGPRAERGRTWFHPDHDWQLDQLASAYVASNRTTTYIGDWHTHPGGAPRPSRRDRRTLRAVRRSVGARANWPLMLILGPRPWDEPSMWCLLSGRSPVRVEPQWFDAEGRL